MKRTKCSLLLISIIVPSLFVPFFASAQEATQDVAVRSQCFVTLKQNLKEAALFDTPLVELNKVTYADIEPQFSEKYKSLQSFDIGIMKDSFRSRIYSFGKPTGYTHPPKSVYPDSYKSEAWKTPAKEYNIIEEYVVDEQGKEHFTDCLFLSIEAGDLMRVAEENIASNQLGVSLLKDSQESYKALYTEIQSFDNKNAPLAIWKKVFIYPQATKNNYFDRYSIIDVFPAKKVESFSVLKFFLQKLLTVSDINRDTGTSTVKYMTLNKDKKSVEVLPPKELIPVTQEVKRSLSYQQAIENMFPEFAKLLSVRGSITWSTYKSVLTENPKNQEIGKFLLAFYNQSINTYYLANTLKATSSMKMSDKEMDRLIPLIQNGDWTIQELRKGAKFDTLVFGSSSTSTSTSVTAISGDVSSKGVETTGLSSVNPSLKNVGAVVALLIVVCGGGLFIYKKRKATASSVVSNVTPL